VFRIILKAVENWLLHRFLGRPEFFVPVGLRNLGSSEDVVIHQTSSAVTRCCVYDIYSITTLTTEYDSKLT
jgi:hypothetical protein